MVLVNPFSDTTTGIWQVAYPVKPTINQAYQDQFALITDSVNHYPTNDSSSFTISLLDEGGFGDNVYGSPHTCYISGYYWSNTDSLNDYGKIELKMPHMDFWIDLLADSIYSYNWGIMMPVQDMLNWSSQRPVLTGNSSSWNHFSLSIIPLAQHYDVLFGDTLQFRFTFHSDSIPDSLDGLAFDELVFCNYIEGLGEHLFFESTISPNPALDEIFISFNQSTKEPVTYSIENALGESIVTGTILTVSEIIDISTLKPGIYLVRCSTLTGEKKSRARFVKS
jgi:hypothetical protein